MREAGLLAPQRARGRRRPRAHDGTIIPPGPNRIWGTDAIRDRFGAVGADVGRGISLRHDWGPQYTSFHFGGAVRWLGLTDSPAYVGEPPCNGCAERFIRTLKEQCIWSRTWRTADELAAGVRAFVAAYNDGWLIERHGHRTPREAYARALAAGAA